jgi:hypothetical protein
MSARWVMAQRVVTVNDVLDKIQGTLAIVPWMAIMAGTLAT